MARSLGAATMTLVANDPSVPFALDRAPVNPDNCRLLALDHACENPLGPGSQVPPQQLWPGTVRAFYYDSDDAIAAGAVRLTVLAELEDGSWVALVRASTGMTATLAIVEL